jgi:hypothetical protein
MNRLDRTIVSQFLGPVQGFFDRLATPQILLCLLCLALWARRRLIAMLGFFAQDAEAGTKG